ncbi:MAG: hypothetical protein LUH15_03015, partial [Tannerellaceae bacterium]|nr:hypothetical protein [Tannerellaceae bacterium]
VFKLSLMSAGTNINPLNPEYLNFFSKSCRVLPVWCVLHKSTGKMNKSIPWDLLISHLKKRDHSGR